jgi:hypothetical protein
VRGESPGTSASAPKRAWVDLGPGCSAPAESASMAWALAGVFPLELGSTETDTAISALAMALAAIGFCTLTMAHRPGTAGGDVSRLSTAFNALSNRRSPRSSWCRRTLRARTGSGARRTSAPATAGGPDLGDVIGLRAAGW